MSPIIPSIPFHLVPVANLWSLTTIYRATITCLFNELASCYLASDPLIFNSKTTFPVILEAYASPLRILAIFYKYCRYSRPHTLVSAIQEFLNESINCTTRLRVLGHFHNHSSSATRALEYEVPGSRIYRAYQQICS